MCTYYLFIPATLVRTAKFDIPRNSRKHVLLTVNVACGRSSRYKLDEPGLHEIHDHTIHNVCWDFL